MKEKNSKISYTFLYFGISKGILNHPSLSGVGSITKGEER